MDWRNYEKEIEQYYQLSNEDRKGIAQEGIKTEFWKLLRAYMCNTLRVLETSILHSHVSSLDDLMKLARLRESHKSVSEILNLVDMFINPPQVSAVIPRAGSPADTPKRVIKKEI